MRHVGVLQATANDNCYSTGAPHRLHDGTGVQATRWAGARRATTCTTKSPTKKNVLRQKIFRRTSKYTNHHANRPIVFFVCFLSYTVCRLLSPPPGRRVVLFVGRVVGTMFAGNVAPIASSAFANDIHAGRKPACSTGSFIETILRPAGLGLLEFVSGCFCRPAGFVAEAVGSMIERV